MKITMTCCLLVAMSGCAAYEDPKGEFGEEELALESTGEQPVEAAALLPNNFPFPNSSGVVATFSTTGSVDLESEFFQEFGTNERTCGTCHLPSDGWGSRPCECASCST